MATKTCPICGKEFEQNSNIQKYCSEGCRRVAQGRRNKKMIMNHNKGLGGVKYKIIAAYHGECAICGWKGASGLYASKRDGKMDWSFGNELHHIVRPNDGGKADGENLILLCPNHHKQADRGLITEEELRKHLRPVPLPKEEVEHDMDLITDALTEYYEYKDKHPYDDGVSPASVKLNLALDLAIMLGNAGLIDGFLDPHDQIFTSYEVLKENIVNLCKEVAEKDTKSNEYPVRDWNWYERCLGKD